MDVREKLVELLDIIIQPGQKTLGDIADYLISNGVTVQEWISVKDRSPEDDSDVIAYLQTGEEGRIFPANYANGVWYDCIFKKRATETTTHWMPIPQPPKEEV